MPIAEASDGAYGVFTIASEPEDLSTPSRGISRGTPFE